METTNKSFHNHENILKEQANHSLQDCLKQLKFGRPAKAQKVLDKFIDLINLNKDFSVQDDSDVPKMLITETPTRTQWICEIEGHSYVRTRIRPVNEGDSFGWHLNEDQEEGIVYFTEEKLEELFWLNLPGLGRVEFEPNKKVNYEGSKFNFEIAMSLLRQGKNVRRAEWPECQFIFLNHGYPVGKYLYPSQPPTEEEIRKNPVIKDEDRDAGIEGQMMSHLIMSPRKESGYWGEGKLDYVPYSPSNFDLFAEDWEQTF